MAASLTLDSVLQFLVENGGRVSQHAIGKHFKKLVKDPENKDAKEQLKDIVNKLAHVERIEGVKYLVLKKKYEGTQLEQVPPMRSSSIDALDSTSTTAATSLPLGASASQHLSGSLQHLMLDSISQSQSIPDPPCHAQPESEALVTENLPQPVRTITKDSTSSGPSDADVPTSTSVPVAPPRKKSIRDSKKSKAPIIPTQGNTSGTNDKDEPRSISVKEQAKFLNRMASQSQLGLQAISVTSNKKTDKNKKQDDEDNGSVSNLDPCAREWMLGSADNNYHDLVRLLKSDTRLASYKDPIFGYTALHWAAKHGNLDIIKLIAGTHAVNVNLTSNGGYTPLHLAAMHDQMNAYDLLVKTYGAKFDLRDYSGKTARQHFSSARKPNSGKNTAATTALPNKKEQQLQGFLRIGSFNVKVRRTAEALEKGSKDSAARLRKAWSSADSLSNDHVSSSQMDKQLMPPPKQLPPGRRTKAKSSATIHSGSVDSVACSDSE